MLLGVLVWLCVCALRRERKRLLFYIIFLQRYSGISLQNFRIATRSLRNVIAVFPGSNGLEKIVVAILLVPESFAPGLDKSLSVGTRIRRRHRTLCLRSAFTPTLATGRERSLAGHSWHISRIAHVWLPALDINGHSRWNGSPGYVRT